MNENQPVQPILEANNILVKKGGVTVLDIPHFSIKQGKHLSLVGPNGAGKSTLLLTLANLLKLQQDSTSDKGEIYFKGNKIYLNYSTAIAYRRNISMVFQEPLLFNTTVFDNVASGLKIRGIRSSEIQNTVNECLQRFGISHLNNRSARKLSSGEAKRTSLARAFATKPEILFLDEPFSSLDLPTRELLIEDLEKNSREMGTTTIMATHDQMEVLQLSDYIMVMDQGKIVQSGTPDEIISHPANKFVSSFMGEEKRRILKR
ncbi:ABC transporter ATP-binding protein [bacterium]|nr:ABC transporter ATP-binding protein [bacterium]MBU1754600.1 ABC transporter ATP-binding protein [bacterium]